MKIHQSITVDRVTAAAEDQMFGLDDPGFCVACGEDVMGVDPDTRRGKCECCGKLGVFGASELLFYMVA